MDNQRLLGDEESTGPGEAPKAAPTPSAFKHPLLFAKAKPKTTAAIIFGIIGAALLIILLSVYLAPVSHEKRLRNGQVIPDVIDGIAPQGITITIVYQGRTVHDGDELTPTFTANIPTITINGATGDEYLTLIMSDPDAPSPQDRSLSEYLHFLVVDIRGNISNSNILVPYVGPGPPEGLHRYVFGLYRQPNDAPLGATAPTDRPLFHQKDFAQQYNLGLPIDATWFGARPEAPPRLGAQKKSAKDEAASLSQLNLPSARFNRFTNFI